jgi:hypothetical protein
MEMTLGTMARRRVELFQVLFQQGRTDRQPCRSGWGRTLKIVETVASPSQTTTISIPEASKRRHPRDQKVWQSGASVCSYQEGPSPRYC